MGQNVFVAAYREFQLGTGSKPNVPVGDVRNPSAKYEYQSGGTGRSVDGTFMGTDCSNLVWRALKDAGYMVPDMGSDHSGFTTNTLFTGTELSDFSKANFDFISKADTLTKNGNLQVGDIIMFKSNTGDGQHVGIFFGYDSAGDPMFYGSQTSTGPAIANMTPESTWNGKDFEVVGALRPKDSFYDPTLDTTTNNTEDPQTDQSFIGAIKETISTVASGFCDIPDYIDDIKKKVSAATTTRSPIVLDLNGDGLTTTDVTNGTYFDHNANGFAENTGWVNAQDGILVRDLDGNGTIDSGRELFGSETLLANGQHAANGYTALAELDTNLDGQINAQEAANANIKIWKDTNGDGYSSADELFTLADAGVQSIATGSTAANQLDANGNTVKQTGTFTKADGSTGNSADIWFAVNNTNTIATDWLPETAAVASLPDLQGYGNVRDLHQAILRDNTGRLQDLVQQFINATDVATRHTLTTQIIYAWAGVENIDPASRRSKGSASHLNFQNHATSSTH